MLKAMRPKRRALSAGIVVELPRESGCLVGGLDDDPFIAGAAERLALDELARQPVAGHARPEFLGRLPAAGRSSISSLARIPETAAITVAAAVLDDTGQRDGLELVQGR